MISDFSIMSFIQASEVLSTMAHSSVQSDKSAVGNVLKMAACLSIVTSKWAGSPLEMVGSY